MCCPQGGNVALGTVWSGGSRWLTWLQAKWAKSPEASNPWKEKRGEVEGGQPGQRSRSIRLTPSPRDRSMPQGQAQGRMTNVSTSTWIPHPVPFRLAHLPPHQAMRG